MSNVEKKNADDFEDWRKAKNMLDTETHSSGPHYILSFLIESPSILAGLRVYYHFAYTQLCWESESEIQIFL